MTDETTYIEPTKEEKLKMIDTVCDEDAPYFKRIEAYEYLCENAEDIVDQMIERLYQTSGESQQMLLEILSNYKGRKEVYMWLVTYLYRGEDVPLFARLLGSYGNPAAIDVLKSFAEENELNYSEFMEIRNAVEELGGEFTLERDFSDDPYYHLIKGEDSGEVSKIYKTVFSWEETDEADGDGEEE